MATAARSYFCLGGTLPANVLSYVERTADTELLAALLAEEFCYVLDTRQVGKSSLMVRTAQRLHAAGKRCAILDLSSIGENLTQEQWYFGMLSELAVSFQLETEVEAYWIQHPSLSSVQRWFATLRGVLLPRLDAPLIVFIDEIDAVRKLPFSADEFFAAIRECHNRRTSYPDKHSITFCLIGVATPSDLIQDVRTTPFNIGKRVELHDFSLPEAIGLADGLPGNRTEQEGQIRRICYWTAGHPYLTQKFCQAVAERESPLSPKEIDLLCHTIFLCRRALEEEDNLKFVSRQVLSEESTRADILLLYGRIRKGKPVGTQDASEVLVNRLLLAGLVRAARDTGHLAIRNRIYLQAFGPGWARSNMPHAEVQRQQAALRRYVTRATLISASFAGLLLMTIYQTQRAAWQSAMASKANSDLKQLQSKIVAASSNLSAIQTKLTGAQSTATQVKQQKDALERKKHDLEVTIGRQESDLKRIAGSVSQQQIQLSDLKDEKQRLIDDVNRVMAPLTVAGYGREADALQFGLSSVEPALEKHKRPSRAAMQVLVDAVSIGIMRSLRLIHPGNVFDADVSPDKSRLVTGGAGRYAYVWDAVNGTMMQRLAVLPATAPYKGIDNVFYSKDGRWIVTASDDYRVRIWDAHKQEALQTRPLVNISVGATSYTMASLSQDGRRMVTTTARSIATVWELSTSSDHSALTCRRLKDLKISAADQSTGKAVCAVDISADGKYVATGGQDQTLRIWNVETGQPIAVIKDAHAQTIRSVRFSPWGADVITGGDDAKALFWSRDTNFSPAIQYPGHMDALNDVEIGGAQLYVCTAGAERCVRIWSFYSGFLPLFTLNTHTDKVMAARFSGDTQSLVTASLDHTAEFWKLTVPTFSGSNGPATCVAFSPSGQSVLCCRRDGLASVWNWRTGQHMWHFNSEGLPHQSAQCTHAVFSHDGRSIATACADGSIRLWQPEAVTKYTCVDNPKRILQGRTGIQVSTITYSPDDRWILTASDDGTAVLWNSATGKQAHVFHDPAKRIFSAFFAPDGRTIVTASDDGGVRLWNIDASSPRQTLWPPGRQQRSKEDRSHPASAVFSPDGRYVLSADTDHHAYLWETQTGRYIGALQGHGAALSVVAFSPDGKWIATGSADRTVCLWDTAEALHEKKPSPLYTLRSHASDIKWLDFSPDGKWLTTSSRDGTCRVYPATFEGMVQKARELAKTHYKESQVP